MTSTRCNSAAIGSSNFCKLDASEPAGDAPLLTIVTPMPCSLRGGQKGVNLEAQIALDVVREPTMIRAMLARRRHSLALILAVAFIAACSRNPDRVRAREIESLIRDDRLQEA